MQLNGDVGEGWPDRDAELMPYLDLANIACGGHAGDDLSMGQTLSLAKGHYVKVGAHPSYPDVANFGRHSLADVLDQKELLDSLDQQVADFVQHCAQHGLPLHHIKAHGALYNDANERRDIMQVLIELAKKYHTRLMIQALPQSHAHFGPIRALLSEHNVTAIFEGFADRRYELDGRLRSRALAGAVLESVDAIRQQAMDLTHKGRVQCAGNRWLSLSVQSICLHGDHPLSVQAAKSLHSDRQHTDA